MSGEIVLERLIETLLRMAIEHAGAERGVLLLTSGAGLLMQAEATVDATGVRVHLRERPVSADDLAESVVQYVARTQETVILDDASTSDRFSTDVYIRRAHARSILCLPLVKQGRLVAVLYLENHLAPGVFTPARIAVLQVLAPQAAMSLENSRLYRELERREAKIRRLVDANIVGVAITRVDGAIIEANDAALEICGIYPRGRAVGTTPVARADAAGMARGKRSGGGPAAAHRNASTYSKRNSSEGRQPRPGAARRCRSRRHTARRASCS